MRIVRSLVGTVMILCLTLAPAVAGSKAKGPAPVKVSPSKAPAAAKATPAPKTTKAANVAKAPKVATTAKASSAPKRTAVTSQTKVAKAETKSAKKSSGSLTTSATTTTPTAPTIDFTQGKVGQKLTQNTKQAEKLGNKLAAMGYTGDVFGAAYGFKNFGQFNAAVNNAQNHNLSFEQLKTLMTGVSVDAAGVVRYANRNPDGTVTMVPFEALRNPAPTASLGQAKKTIATSVVNPATPGPTRVTN